MTDVTCFHTPYTQVTRANKGRALTSIKAINDPFITPVRAFTPLVSAV